MAISKMSYHNSMMNYLDQQQSDIYKCQMQIGTGKKYIYRSENPINAMRSDTISNEYELQKQYKSNVESAYNVEQLANSTLGVISDNFQRVYELTVQSKSGSQDANSLDAMAKEIDSLLDSLVDLGNTSFNGVEIYAGTQTGSSPFTIKKDPVTNKEYATFLDEKMTPAKTVDHREVQLSENTTMSYGLTGNELFNFTAKINTGTEESPVMTEVDISSLDYLIELRDKLNAGTEPSTQDLEKLQAITSHMSDMTVKSSSSLDVLKTRKENFLAVETVYNNTISFLDDADAAKVTTELAEVKNSYEATLLLVAQMNKLSILNFIK